MEKTSTMKAYIIANGEFPIKKSIIDELKKANFIAVCDGAIKYLDKLKIMPNLIIGDLDSISKELKEKYKDKLIHIKEQMSNDLSKAFYHCLNLGFDEFIFLASTGKREDHTLANISLMIKYSKDCKNLTMKSDYGEFKFYETPCKIQSYKGEQISIFCFDKNIKFNSKNLKYPLKNMPLPFLASATLNEVKSDVFYLSSNKKAKVLIYKAYKNTI